MPVSVLIPAALREYAAGRGELPLDAAKVTDALAALTRDYPALRRQLFSESGELRPYVNVYVNQDDVRDLPAGLDSPLEQGDVITILPSIAGG